MKLRSEKLAQSGNTLVVTLITLILVSVFVSTALDYTNGINRNVHRSILYHQATNIADSSTEMAFSSWRAICRQNQSKVYPLSSFTTAIPTPTPGDFPGVATYTLLNYEVYPLNSTWTKLTTASATPAPIAGPNHGDLSYYYLATADVVIPTLDSKSATSETDTGNVVAKVRRVFDKETLSLWRYAVFYNDDMEIHPGATMAINGDVHTNGSLYTGHSDLALDGVTTYVNSWTIGFDPNEDSHAGETPESPTWATGLPPAASTTQQPYGVALSDYHQLIDYTSQTTTLDPYRFQEQAGVVVTIDANNNVVIYNSAGTNITSKTGHSNDGNTAAAFKAAISTNQTIVDNRQGATTGNANIRVATLDVSVIEAAMDSTSSKSDFTISKSITSTGQTVNNMVYIVDTSGITGSSQRAIRIKNGGKLPSGGLTIASANPIYVQGDYNTGASGTTLPQSDSSTPDPTKPTVAGYTRQPAAIVGDAVTVLSNSWLDSKAGTMPTASNTTVNAAFISGIVPSANGNYSGGVENFPRFLEDWGNKQFTYYGSMIELYNSQQAIGKWGAGNVYNPPNRAWYFDTNFVSSPPPGILASFNYNRSRWYME
jgi:hypothetical protein